MLLKQRSAINPPTDKALEEQKGKQYVMVSDAAVEAVRWNSNFFFTDGPPEKNGTLTGWIWCSI